MSDERWIKVHDGMPDPAARIPGGPVLTQRRRAALTALLRRMGCRVVTEERCEGVEKGECSHYALVSEVGEVLTCTTVATLVEAIRTLPRPISMPDVDDLASRFESVTLVGQGEGT